MRSKHWLRVVVGFAFHAGLLIAAGGVGAQAPVKYRFDVVPQYSAAELQQDWLPLLTRISRDTGIPLELKLSASIPKFEAEFLKGTPDFAYMNPYHAVMARQAQGYVPLLREAKGLAGILVVQRGSPYQSVQELNGKLIGFPAPNAFGASLYMRALLSESENIRFEARYLNNHPDAVRRAVAANYEKDYLPLEKLKIQKYLVTAQDLAPVKT